MKNYYKILGVDGDSSQQQIKIAYRNLSKKHHPDVNDGSKESEKIFKDVQEAYSVLKDTATRQTYDAKLKGNSQSRPDTSSNSSQRNDQGGTTKQDFDFGQIEKDFEHFFGFNPKTKEMSSGQKNSGKKNPLDTTDFFESYFKK